MDHKRNEKIREELEIYSLSDKIKEYRKKLIDHLGKASTKLHIKGTTMFRMSNTRHVTWLGSERGVIRAVDDESENYWT